MVLISLSVVLLVLHSLLEEREDKIIKLFFGKNIFWIVTALLYASLIIISLCTGKPQETSVNMYEKIFGADTLKWILSWNPFMVGICGAAFCTIWMTREWFLIYIEKRREKKIQE